MSVGCPVFLAQRYPGRGLNMLPGLPGLLAGSLTLVYAQKGSASSPVYPVAGHACWSMQAGTQTASAWHCAGAMHGCTLELCMQEQGCTSLHAHVRVCRQSRDVCHLCLLLWRTAAGHGLWKASEVQEGMGEGRRWEEGGGERGDWPLAPQALSAC